MNNKKLKIKNFLKEFSKIAGMLLACAALGFFLAIGIRSSSPDRIAKKYFSYYVWALGAAVIIYSFVVK